MSETYRFTCKADPSKDFDVNVSDTFDIGSVIESMTKTGFEVVCLSDGHSLAIEPKSTDRIPDFHCDLCGSPMDFISDTIGHSCRNRNCLLHVRRGLCEELA